MKTEPGAPLMRAIGSVVVPELSTLALTATPAPDMLLIASRGVSQGRSAGFASLADILAGTYCHTLAVACGLS